MRAVAVRLIRFICDDIESLYQDALELRMDNASAMTTKRTTQCGMEGWTAQAEQQFRNGYYSRVMEEVKCNGGKIRPEWNEETEAVIQSKLRHPELPMRDTVAEIKALRAKGVTFTLFDGQVFLSLLAKVDAKKAGGLSGHRYSHLRAALTDKSRRMELADVHAQLCNIINGGGVPDALVPYTHGGKGNIAGTSRLFVSVEMITRLAGAGVKRAQREKVEPKEMFKFNVGVGIQGGSDYIRAWAEDTVTSNWGVQDLVMLEADAHNMFNEVHRRTLLKMVHKKYPAIYPTVAYYTKAQFVLMFRGKVKEEMTGGIPIGSTMASMLASLAGEIVLEDLKTKCSKEILGLLSFIDNVFIILSARDVERVMQQLNDSGDLMGLIFRERESHRHKIHFVRPTNLSQPLDQWMQHFDRRFWELSAATGLESPSGGQLQNADGTVLSQGIKLAGIHYGSLPYYRDMTTKAVAKAKEKLELVAAHAEPFEAATLIRKCVLATLDYARRTLVAKAAGESYEEFDAEVRSVLELKMGGVHWAHLEKVLIQLHLPAKEAGMGMRMMGGDTAAAANIASEHAAYRVNNKGRGSRAFTAHAKTVNSRMSVNDQIPETYVEAMKHLDGIGKSVAKTLAHAMLQRYVVRLDNMLSHEEEVRREDMRKPLAMMYLYFHCYNSVLSTVGPRALPSISSMEYAYLFRRALFMDNPHNLELNRGRVCGRVFQKTGIVCSHKLGFRLEHAESACLAIRGAKKHQGQQNSLQWSAIECGAVAVASGLIPETTKHADLTISGVAVRDLIVDVTNVMVPKASVKGVAKCLDPVEKRKNDKYRAHCRAGGMDFFTLASTQWGSFGPSCDRVFGPLATLLSERDLVTKSKAFMALRLRQQAALMHQIARNGMYVLEAERRHEMELAQAEAIMGRGDVAAMEREERNRQSVMWIMEKEAAMAE
jgi:hypothetical protein